MTGWRGAGPIRIGRDEWVLMRDDPRIPAALVRLIDRGGPYEHYRVVSFDIDPARRRLLGRYTSLLAADRSVLYSLPGAYRAGVYGGPPNGRGAASPSGEGPGRRASA
ncbi:hypothetical protein [Naasia aerilata]|uniref:Uncharacterized protein n=1 Tax=Naasia aerilata TaxID=1162966 RepID=A0ABM8GH04_9MICO|nr:hypothetical protein [Naasia aerilata]BDZ47422.1 hypothetical protein GCM10025866_33310 [Naasia aerilata]